MKTKKSIIVILLLAAVLVGTAVFCASSAKPEDEYVVPPVAATPDLGQRIYAELPLTEGFTMESDGTVCYGGEAVGALTLTDLTAEDLEDEQDRAVGRYLDKMGGISEYFGSNGYNAEGPAKNMTHYVTDPETEQRFSYRRVLFLHGGQVYDMWFDLSLIEEETLSPLIDAL